MKESNQPIDFVICWVNGNDPAWREEKNKYKPGKYNDDRNVRYRDWDNLQYWFRAVEKFAPWVNKIHFVTWGHLPSWLNTKHPKINIVQHEDYIPEKYLPTFSARPIEVNLHRIEGLAEQFVYFNDDMFLLQPVNKADFFKNGLPRNMAVLDIPDIKDEVHGNAVFNAIVKINKYFDKRKVIKENFFKWFNPLYKKHLVRTILLYPWSYFTGFYSSHLPSSFLKSTFNEVWQKEFALLELTSSHRFRNKLDVTQYIFKYWQLVTGNFKPTSSYGRAFNLGIELQKAKKMIEDQKIKMICLNDNDEIENFEDAKSEIIDSFEKILPNKSEFEI